MKAKIIITPKKAVLDPQGKTVQNALEHMGYSAVVGVHVGKYLEIDLAPGTDADVTIDALYAFTDCQSSISVNACVIVDEKPRFMSVNEILELSTERTKELLKKELQIKQAELNEKWHFSSLEKIFIEKRRGGSVFV